MFVQLAEVRKEEVQKIRYLCSRLELGKQVEGVVLRLYSALCRSCGLKGREKRALMLLCVLKVARDYGVHLSYREVLGATRELGSLSNKLVNNVRFKLVESTRFVMARMRARDYVWRIVARLDASEAVKVKVRREARELCESLGSRNPVVCAALAVALVAEKYGIAVRRVAQAARVSYERLRQMRRAL